MTERQKDMYQWCECCRNSTWHNRIVTKWDEDIAEEYAWQCSGCGSTK